MSRGFTLLELLVAMAVFGVVGVMAVGGLGAVLAGDRAARDQQERLREVQLAVQTLERDLAQAVARTVRDRYGDPLAAVLAARDGIELTRGGFANPLAHRRSELQRVGYRLQDESLLRAAWPMLDRAPGLEPRETEMLAGVQAFQVRWLDDRDRWLDLWPPVGLGATAWPRAAEVRLRLADWGEITRLIPLVEGPAPEAAP